MKVKELIEELQKLPPELDVKHYDDESSEWNDINGAEIVTEDTEQFIALTDDTD